MLTPKRVAAVRLQQFRAGVISNVRLPEPFIQPSLRTEIPISIGKRARVPDLELGHAVCDSEPDRVHAAGSFWTLGICNA